MSSTANPTVSVALCTYDGENFLRTQLDSIAAQTHPPDEIVICDDRSDDSTTKIIESFVAESAIPIHWQINPTRLGVTKNFEKAISLATGDIIFLADQDDLWHPDKVSRILPHFSDMVKTKPGTIPRIAMVFSNGQVIDSNGSPLGYTLWDSMWFDSVEQQRRLRGDALPVLLRHAVAAGATLAFRSSYRPLLLPIPDLPHCHDIWITLLLACAAQIYPLNEALIDYRLHSSNEVGLKKHGLLSQIRMARWQLRFGAFQYAADLHQAAMDRLAEHDYLSEPTKWLLEDKIAHSQIRHAMPRSIFNRIPIILRELRNGRYAQYSYGYKSVLQDLFLR
jgi:glycosyltransferase involved in cell wall biosynthesis